MKFKVGDKIILKSDTIPASAITHNKIYEVGGPFHGDTEWGTDRIGIVKNDNGRPDGWVEDFFELAISYINEQKLRKKLGL